MSEPTRANPPIINPDWRNAEIERLREKILMYHHALTQCREQRMWPDSVREIVDATIAPSTPEPAEEPAHGNNSPRHGDVIAYVSAGAPAIFDRWKGGRRVWKGRIVVVMRAAEFNHLVEEAKE